MVNSAIMTRILTITSIIAGVFNLVLYFYNVIPGQIPAGAPFYLRMGIVFIVGVPFLIQMAERVPTPQRPKVASILALIAVLAMSVVVMMLLLPSMMVGWSWGD